MDGTVSGLRRDIREAVAEWRRDVRDSDFGLLKTIGIEAIPFASGAMMAGIGRATDLEILPVVPLAMDAMQNAEGYASWRGLWTMTKYGTGVAAVYADKWAPLVTQYFS